MCMCFKANDFAYVSAIWPLVLVNVLTERGGGYNRYMVFNATFSNISIVSWRSVLLVKENGVHRENHRPTTSH